MEIHSMDSFLDYYKRIRNRTQRLIGLVPPNKIDWAYQKDKFTFGDLLRHIAAIERYMYAENVQGKPSLYKGCGKEMADDYEAIVILFDVLHKESMEIFGRLKDSDLNKKCSTPAGIEITIWKWLRAMVEHEIHHRGQLYMYLNMIGVKTPPLFGLTAEQVQENYLR